ncbi:MAG: hypothetical protein HY863_10055 [Chloroflexi bacterium]|nr:hypothetical protein [Chloroflexota bacterium]
MKKISRLFNLIIIAALFLGACNLPSSDQGQQASLTSAAQTVEALLSATPLLPVITPSLTPQPVTATLTPVPPTVNTNTPQATATSNCNVGQFITDVTIPDGTIMTPGQTFTKKWRIKNIGSCAWTGFSLVFDSGDSMGAPASKAISDLGPGQEVDIEVALTAPTPVGNYRGYFRINTNGGVLVPIVSGHLGKTFYVDIKVQNPATATNTPVVFAVTSVTFNVTGTCPNFNYTYSVTTNAAGTVNLHRIFSDGGTDTAPVTMVFSSAGTLTSPVIARVFGVPASSAWVDIYIDTPNNQQFGRATFTCP